MSRDSRAVAVLLVVFYHAGVTGLTGGYVGVDVFFVISGFVITGVLLRERASRAGPRSSASTAAGPTDHPGRHAGDHRHLVAAYLMLGVVYGNPTADRRPVGRGVPGQLPFRRPSGPTT